MMPRLLSVRRCCGGFARQRGTVSLHAEQLEDRRLLSRSTLSLDSSWQFIRQDVTGAEAVSLDDSAWTAVNLPHTWNNLDGQDGGNNYYRGIGWYRKHYTVPAELAGQELFIRFDGANYTTDLYVNGSFVGEHQGGFAAFVWDVTPYLKAAATNIIAVKVSNVLNAVAVPQSGDITWDGGLYRHVNLIATDPLHISLTDYASPGVYLQQSNVSAAAANLQITSKLQNDSLTSRQATVVANVVDAAGNLVQTLTSTVTLNPHAGSDVVQRTALVNPHLWNGRNDPYMYQVRVQMIDSTTNTVTDQVTQPLGLRFESIDPSNGFFLNGQHLDLHGVGFHQDRLNEGWAISDADQIQDMSLVQEIGATFVRLTLYQHPPLTYDLLDADGIIAWSDLPVIDTVVAATAYYDNAKQQLREMIRQNYNHPALLFWGLYDELSDNGTSEQLVSQLVQLAHQEDPSRLTTAATNLADNKPINYLTDVIGFNKYYGWYYGSYDQIAAWADSIHAASPNRAIGVSEYGAGASIYQHQINAYYPQYPAYTWHPEEYQEYLHEGIWMRLKSRPFLWVKNVWDMFDFAVDSRNEGDTPGRNDKGLVTYDRQIRKDAFYWYKANWSTDPVLYITSRRYTNRPSNVLNIRAYSNLDAVQLSVNGVVVGTLTSDTHVFQWNNVVLSPGPNAIEVTATRNGVTYTDDVTWYAPLALDGVLFARINFQPAGTPVPNGYLPDYGSVFGDRGNGFSYGWDVDNSANAAVRGVMTDLRYDTLISMQAPLGGHVWEIAVPNGTYAVHLVSGDPSYFDSIYQIAVEGALAVSGGVNVNSRSQEAWRTVTVADGRLTISNAPGSSNNKLDFIEINRLDSGTHVASAVRYVVTASTGSTAGSPFSVTVIALNASGNIAAGYTGTVHFTSGDSQAVLPADYTFVNGDAGIHTFTATLKTAGSQSIVGVDTLTGSISGNVTLGIVSATATHLGIRAPAFGIAGTAFNGTVTALDPYGNTATNYSGRVHFTSSDAQAALPADYTFTSSDAGVHTFSNVLFKTAGSQNIAATDTASGALNGTVSVGVFAAQATRFTIRVPADLAAGTAFNGTVAALDPYSNIATGYTGTVHFSSSDAQSTLPGDYTFSSADGGVHSFSNVLFRTAGSQSITATDTFSGAINGNISVGVVAAAASRYAVYVPAGSIAGMAFSGTVTVLDLYGNTVTGYLGTVHFASSDSQALLPVDYTFVSGDAGFHNFTDSLALLTAGSETVIVSDAVSALISGSATVAVKAAPATHYVLSAPPSSIAGNPVSGTLTALDPYGNIATGYLGTVGFASSDGQAQLPAVYRFVSGDAGVHTFTNLVTLKTAGNQVVVARDIGSGWINGNAALSVAPGPASLYAVSAPLSSAAGSTFSVTVTAMDAYGNTATGYTGPVHLASSDAHAVLPADYIFVNNDGGVHTFGAVTLKTAGSQRVIVLDTSTGALSGSSSIVVRSVAASYFVANASGSPVAGTPFDLTVIASDPYGNVDPTYQGTVLFTTSDATGGRLPDSYTFTAADGGTHTFAAAATLFTAGSQTVSAIDAVSGITGSATTVIAPAPVDHFVLAVLPHVTAGVSFDLTLVALDVYGNIDTNYRGTVHFTTSDAGPAVLLPPDYTFGAGDKGIHTFADGFVLVTEGSQTLMAADSADVALFSSVTITVDPGGEPPPPGSAGTGDTHPSIQVIDPMLVVDTTRSGQRLACVDRVFASLEIWKTAGAMRSFIHPPKPAGWEPGPWRCELGFEVTAKAAQLGNLRS